ncbi:zinc-binding dehydrogenase [Chishuiella sp.]|uniref:zinc-binding dehydrogenase n=1 Tax=Chishuiella sp. TaxID=1969467 RepID=UPI0028A708CA|nr:zinc-binding dehydrogenase [Chishuiella sp.]
MKALVLQENGNIESLKVINNREIPQPGDNDIQIRVHASGLNPSDYQMAMYPGIKDERERVLGLEISGIVTKIGKNVNKFKVGDRVYYLRGVMNLDGGFAEYSITPAHAASHLPKEVSFYTAATIPAAGFTAYQAIIDKLRPKYGKTIFIEGGSGGVGYYAIQLAKMCGLKVIASCNSKNINYIKEIEVDEIIAYDLENVYDRVKELTNNKGVNYILNTINSETATKDLDVLSLDGEIAVIAGFPDFNKLTFFEKGISIHEIALSLPFQYNDYEGQCNIARIGDEFATLLEKKQILSANITLIDLEEVPLYLNKIKNREILGKVVMKLL